MLSWTMVQATKMQTAEEVGRVAWTVGATKEGNDQVCRDLPYQCLQMITLQKYVKFA